MKELILHPFEPELTFNESKNTDDSKTTATGYKITMKKGRMEGVGVSVSGAGAYAKMSGHFSFELKRLESSKTYQKMVKDYSIGGGIRGFWGWLGIGVNASTHKTEIQTALKEISESQKVDGYVEIDLMVTGLYPNVQVDASAYVLVLEVTDEQGNKTIFFSNASPNTDIGSQDQDGNNLPVKDNNSTIKI